MKKYLLFLLGLLCAFIPTQALYAVEEQPTGTDANIVGHIKDKKTGEHLSYLTVSIVGTTIGTVTDVTGHYYLKNLPEKTFVIKVSAIGYKPVTKEVTMVKGKTIELNFELDEDAVALDGVVVSANRNATIRREAPTLVNVLGPKLFEQTNSQTLSQGLCFQSGVRVENDCQNCGYTQVRINGMEGKYTQILIDSRPIFSSLAGVYGLEQIPSNMIERVEVVRGGGSALFGSSAIAGTINVITKEPLRNTGTFSHVLSNIDGSGAFENNTNMNLSLVSQNNKMGAYVYGQNRYRSAWDSNGDAFSELSRLKNQTFGINAYYKTGIYSKLNLEYHHSEEFRRGGSSLDLPPHIAEDAVLNGTGEPGIVEQIKHSINTGGIKFNAFTPNQKNTFTLYASAQDIHRESYYSAYGQTKDLTAVVGGQYVRNFDKLLFMPSNLTAGLEFNHDNLDDKATDVEKYRNEALAENPNATGEALQALIQKYTPTPLHQIINTSSAFVQNEWKNEMWSFLIGARLDKNSILDHAIISPRANIRYNPIKDVNIRMSYAEGFRAPQAFDEDLHIGTIGGDLVRIVLDKNLKEERSRTVDASVDYYHSFGDIQANFLLEGFYTTLSDPFVLSAPVADPNGSNYQIQTRYNGSGAKVYGLTAEAKLAYSKLLQLQVGMTVHKSLYDSPEEWSTDTEHLTEEECKTDKFLRTPGVYGYFTASYTPTKALSIALNGNYTGKMYVPHLMSGVDGTADQLVKSKDFFEMGAKVSYDVDLDYGLCMEFNVGVQNMFNSYQKDFDKGATRDSGYIYGPSSPRTYYAGVKLSF